MAGLMRRDQITPQNLDQLLQFSELIRSIVDTANLADIIKEIQDAQAALKTQQDALAAAGTDADTKTKALDAATAANEQSIADLNDAKKDAANAQANADAASQKAQILQKNLDQAQANLTDKVQAANDDIAHRTQVVTDKENAASSIMAQALSMKDDYQTKIDALKALTGG